MNTLNKNLTFLLAVSMAIVSASLFGQQPTPPSKNAPDETKKPVPIQRLGKIKTDSIHESSGLEWCSKRADSVWTFNDSGNSNEVFLISTEGDLLATVELTGARNLDWEAMCSAEFNGVRHLIVGDVGDNRSRRKNCRLYCFPEPNVKQSTNENRPVKIQTKAIEVQFKYEDGPHNCEAIAYDQDAKKLWLFEKRYVDDARNLKPGVFTLDLNLKDRKLQTAKRIGDYPIRNVTGMAFSPDQNRLIVRNYLNAHLYIRAAGSTWEKTFKSTQPSVVVLPIQRQGEAICFKPDSRSVIVTSEIKRQPIWQIQLAK